MSMERALHNLSARIDSMNDVLAELQITVARDLPEPMAFAADIEQRIDDLQIGLLEIHQRFVRLTSFDRPQEQIADVWQALLLSQQQIDRVESVLCALNSMDHLAPLWRHGLREGGEWLDWTRVVTDGLGRCVQQIQQVREAQLLGLHEMAERDASGLVTVHNRTIGQQVNVYDDQVQAGQREMWGQAGRE